jgi:hypothetical protein
LHFEEGIYKEDVEDCEKILEWFPDIHIVENYIGNCYFEQEKD